MITNEDFKWRIRFTFTQLTIIAIICNAHSYVLIPNIRLIIESFNETYIYVGILLGAYTFMCGVAALGWALYSDVSGFQRRLLMAAGIAAGGVLTVLSSSVENKFFFALLYILGGMTLSVIRPLAATILMDMYRSEERSHKFMKFKIYSGFGIVLGFALGVLVGSWAGWRFPLMILGVLYLVVGIPVALIMREPPKGFSEEQLHEVLVVTARYPFNLRIGDLKIIAGTRSNIFIVLQGIFGIIASSSIEVWIVQYLVVEAGTNEMVASVYLGIGALGSLGGILVAWIADRLYRRSPKYRPLVAGISAILSSIAFILFLSIPIRISSKPKSFLEALIVVVNSIGSGGMLMLATLFFFCGMLINSSIGSIKDSVVSDVNLPEHRATILSGISIIELLSKSIGIAVMGFLIYVTGSIRIPLMIAVSFWMISSIYWILMSRFVEKDIWKIGIILGERRKVWESMR